MWRNLGFAAMTEAIMLTALTPEEIETYYFALSVVRFGWLAMVLGFVLTGFGFGLGRSHGEVVGFGVIGAGLLMLVVSAVSIFVGESVNPGDPVVKQVLVENSVQLTYALGSFLCATTLGRMVVNSVQPWMRIVFDRDAHSGARVARLLMGTLNDDVEPPDMFPALTRKWAQSQSDDRSRWATALEIVQNK